MTISLQGLNICALQMQLALGTLDIPSWQRQHHLVRAPAARCFRQIGVTHKWPVLSRWMRKDSEKGSDNVPGGHAKMLMKPAVHAVINGPKARLCSM
jgi:hypothetical protein